MTDLFSIQDFRFSYSGKISREEWALSVPIFCLKPQSFTLLTGDNMSGKTTFLKIVAGKQTLHNKSEGFASPQKKACEKFGIRATLLSNADQMFPELSIWENILVTLPLVSRNAESRIKEKCVNFLSGSDIFFDRPIDGLLGELSSGGRALVKLCRAVASTRHILLVDEMTSYLDEKRASFFLDYLIERTSEGDAVVLVSHSDRDRAYVKERITSPQSIIEFHIRRSRNLSVLEAINV